MTEELNGGCLDEREAFEAWIRTREGHPFAGQLANLMWATWQARSASRQEEAPMELALCESQRLVLRIGRTYRFVPVAGCKTCDAMAAQANDAYGYESAAPHQAQEAQGDRHGE